ncbi:hypothetical protein Tsubulata_031972 [Turnera subulata]|uniref:DNA-directed RNA polymerase subunit n=1 Tax=Turnera subulata TaxID=218843 RepID=A0A9Q0GAZ4_9ROSI|nr:hypothetical protein Tsubulata_031972 [Turnera subulata]
MSTESPDPMEIGFPDKQEVPSAILTRVLFSVSTEAEKEKFSVLSIDAVSEVTDPKLGLPNPTSQCSTCGAENLKSCEGHFGVVKFPFPILHPYFLKEVVHILNQICPGCKSIRKEMVKGINLLSKKGPSSGCKYCTGNNMGYPAMKFRVSSKEIFKRTTIIAAIIEKFSTALRRKGYKTLVAPDYWDIIPKDEQLEETTTKPEKRVLSHAQVHMLLMDVDPNFFRRFELKPELYFINYFPVTPNCHRVTEFIHMSSNAQRLMFDERTRAYKKIVDFRGPSNELGHRAVDCLKTSKIAPDHSVNIDPFIVQQKKINDNAPNPSGLRWIKDLILGKRNDHSFRMVVVGDPNLKLDEIGIPCQVAERLNISETLTNWNWDRLIVSVEVGLIEKGQVHVRREGSLVRVRRVKDLKVGDTIYRPLSDGDTVLINRPPSVHQHSLISFSVKVLPVASVLAINPLCCPPFRADFDGDCLHGYVPQSVETRVELTELLALDKQLINTQSGRSLLSFSQDSLVASHLILKDGILFNLKEMQQLQMFFPNHLLPSDASVKAPSVDGCLWTGEQLISMLLPARFGHECPPKDVCACKGEFISSEGSFWLRDTDGNFFQSLIKHSQTEVLDFLHGAQEVLCEWLSTRGLSVSLSDLYLSSDSCSRENMVDEILFGLQDAEHACYLKHLMVDSCRDFLAGNEEVNGNPMPFDVECMSFEKQRSAALSQISLDAFKEKFRDIQSLVYKHASKDNSLLAMFKAGSKGNLLKLVQHSMCLGMQHSLVPLSFRMPRQLSCIGWNKQKDNDAVEFAKRYIPYAVIENSFVTGLNPVECFAHSLTSRDSSFSDNADLPGTLNRKLMFFMRDVHLAYDGTVRNAYGNQIVQFSYKIDEQSVPNSRTDENSDVMASQPVGSLAACAISEAAYSSLDQPISLLEKSPLLNLKNVLESGLKKSNAPRTVSLYLSKKLGRQRYGFEYGALEVQNHLQRLVFCDIVSVTSIIFTPRGKTRFGPWVCHFHVSKEMMKKRSLKVQSIVDTLYQRCKVDSSFPEVQIACKDCSAVGCVKEKDETFCITVAFIEKSKNSSVELRLIHGLILFLLQTVIKGLMEIKKVDILWNDKHKIPKSKSHHGELYLRVTMSGGSDKTKLWNSLVENCIPIMDLIDWSRSHPDNIKDFSMAYGINAGWKLFLNNLESAMSDAGKTVLPEHLRLAANCLSVSGEFVGLNAGGWKKQREDGSSPPTFVQAFFSRPGDCFIKAAKAEEKDDLRGCLDALAWGKVPQIGTGHFDIVYPNKDYGLPKPIDVYSLLGSRMDKHDADFEMPDIGSYDSDKCGSRFLHIADGYASLKSHTLKRISEVLRRLFSYDDIQRLFREVRHILNNRAVDAPLKEKDKSVVMMALNFHPRREDKMGIGVEDIKVIHHPQHKDTRCFALVRTDLTEEDFSYRKCHLAALEIIDPDKAKSFHKKFLQRRPMDAEINSKVSPVSWAPKNNNEWSGWPCK